MPGLKCKRVKPHFVQRGERCHVVSLTLQDLCLCGLLPHSVPPHLHLHIFRRHTLLMGDAKCSESMFYTSQCHTFLHLMPHLHLILFQCLNAFGDLHLSDNATKEGAKWSGELLCSCTRQDIIIARRLRVIVEVHQLLAPGDELNSTDCKQENSRRLIHLLVALYSTLLLLCSYKSRHKRELCKLRCKG